MPTIEKSIVVDRPLRAVYSQWTRFEDYPSFMSEIVNVTWIATGYLRWWVEIAGRRYQIEVEITEQIPNRRVSWASRGSEASGGKVNLYALPGAGTRVMLQLAYSPKVLPRHADPVVTIRQLVERDLERFKRRMERRRTGAS